MRLLVTGGAGYVGSHCVRALCDAGHEVVVLDNLCHGHRDSLDARVEFVQADLADIVTVDELFSKSAFDGVMHFAAYIFVNESVLNPLKYYENNTVNTIHLLRLMQKYSVKKMVFSSTCAVHGEPEEMPISEETSREPINPYAATKLAMEFALEDSSKGWGLGATALRYFNASGAAIDATIGEDHNPEFHLIPLVLQVPLGQREKVLIYGTDYPTRDGTCVRDYIHVLDLADAHVRAIESQKEGVFRAFNVGTGNGTTVQEVIEACREITGHPIPAGLASRREGDPPELYADPSRIKHELGWEPEYTDIRQVVQTAWQWHKSHPDGFGDRNLSTEKE